MTSILLDGRSLTRAQVVAIARQGASIRLDDAQLVKVKRAADFLAEKVGGGEPIYGVTTGFGSNADKLLGRTACATSCRGATPRRAKAR
jgi:Histidine ammonia-lyase